MTNVVNRPLPTLEDMLAFIKSMRSATPGELSRRYGKGNSCILVGKVGIAFGLTPETATSDISKEDALKEGGYSIEEYQNVWEEINGKGNWKPDTFVSVVTFEVDSESKIFLF